MNWDEWMETQYAEWRHQALLIAADRKPETPKLATQRDNYGWRSLPAGTHYFGPAQTDKQHTP